MPVLPKIALPKIEVKKERKTAVKTQARKKTSKAAKSKKTITRTKK
jgi:hypothetical protein